MRSGKASSTAKMVAIWRAMADQGATTVPGFRDPFARQMLTGFWLRILARMERQWQASGAEQRQRFLARTDFIPLRVAVLDQLLLAAVAEGAAQVVILGAGLDTRPLRFPELPDIYEVDFPATQAYKRARVAALERVPRLHFTPVVFGVDALDTALRSAGFDPSLRTVWIWEGVVMYLGDDAVRSTLAAVRALSAPGSTLLLHYHEPLPGHKGPSLLRRLLFSWLGEPQIGLRTQAAMAALVEGAGLRVGEDLDAVQQAARVGSVPPTHAQARVSRILVARV